MDQFKVRQVLQIGTGITKWDNFYLKVGRSLQSNAVQNANEKNGKG